MTYLARLTARLGENSPDDQPTKLTEPGSVGSVSDPNGHSERLPASIIMGLHRLASEPKPRRVASAAAWQRIVEDAQRLKSEGWAATAIALGWSTADLFGVDPKDGDGWVSLALWLNGRSVTVMDDHRAFTAEGGVYYLERWGRPNTAFADPILLWEMG